MIPKNLLLIKGAVPGHPGSDVIVKLAVKYKNQEITLNDPTQTEQNPAAEEAQTEQTPAEASAEVAQTEEQKVDDENKK